MTETKEIKSYSKIIALHLIPGIILVIIYVLMLRSGLLSQYPRLIVMGLSALFSLVPFELGYLLYCAKREQNSYRISKVLGFKNSLKLKEAILYTLILFLLTGILVTVLKPVSDFMLYKVFAWLPEWYVYVQDLSLFNRGAIIAAILVAFIILTVIVPIIEELYFRGFLLARMKWMGFYGVFLNSLLFAVYHFWSPWMIVTRTIALLPLFYFVYKKQSMKLGIFVHCLANFTDVVAYAMLL